MRFYGTFTNARKNERFWARLQLNSTKCEEKFTHMDFRCFAQYEKGRKPSVSSSNISDSRNIFMQ